MKKKYTIKQIIPATGWVAIISLKGKRNFRPLAAWALCADGKVRGLLDLSNHESLFFPEKDFGNDFLGYEAASPSGVATWTIAKQTAS
ncbi:hypothetical protein KKA53_05415 [Candidatus Dependentiae bacterium]|nr:hypothetical protein [Candidatus Dependentiae bacterium]